MNLYDIPKVRGHKILVEVDVAKDLPRTTKIIIPDAVRDNRMKGSDIGRIVAVGPNACAHLENDAPCYAPGDVVLFTQYAGINCPIGPTGKLYRVMHEVDIQAILGVDESIDQEK